MDQHPNLYQFFRPSTIAIVGASNNPTSIGGKPLYNLKKHNFQGEIYPVNPKYSQVQGINSYSSLVDVPEDIDLAMIIVSQNHILNIIEDCKKKQVKFVMIFGAGFAETGEEGKEIQRKLVTECNDAGIRICGPNCIGSINVLDSIPLGFSNTFSLDTFHKGNVGMVSQSGALGYAVFGVSQEQGIGFSYVANTGNQSDLHTVDYLQFLTNDESTEVIATYMEAVPDGEQFRQVAVEAAEKNKPMIVLKSGRSELGKQAAMSHTGSLSGSEEAFHAFAKQHGITLVADNEDLLDSIKVFSRGKRMAGKRVAVISTSGATGILMADNCNELCLQMTTLSEQTRTQLKEILPEFASTVNPVDITAQALNEKDLFRKCLEIIIQAEEVDALVVTTTFAGDLSKDMMEDVVKADQSFDKPIIAALTGPQSLVGQAERILQQNQVPVYQSISKSTTALKRLYDYSFFVNKQEDRLKEPASNFRSFDHLLTKSMNEYDVKRLLEEIGIPTPRGGLVRTMQEAGHLAEKLRFPLVAKAASQDIAHKSDVGGVILPIHTIEEMISSIEDIEINVQRNVPEANLEGILLEEMTKSPFKEMIVGIKNDPQFGPMIMCGLGGVFVETFKDLSLRCAQVDVNEAMDMLKELQAYPLLTGYRGDIEYDIQALAESISKLSQFAKAHENTIKEMEINPLVVKAKGEGVVALDGLISVTPTQPAAVDTI